MALSLLHLNLRVVSFAYLMKLICLYWMSIKNLKKRGSDHGFTDSGEASSGPSTAKNFKYILEESTEESSDSHWLFFKNLKKRGSDHGFKKRKSAHLEDSSSSETEDKEKFLLFS
jgi:hypothetical protein